MCSDSQRSGGGGSEPLLADTPDSRAERRFARGSPATGSVPAGDSATGGIAADFNPAAAEPVAGGARVIDLEGADTG